MNADLLMGEELKKTGAGNLFTVFGEPDVEVSRTEAGEVVVELRGVDVYGPPPGRCAAPTPGRSRCGWWTRMTRLPVLDRAMRRRAARSLYVVRPPGSGVSSGFAVVRAGK